MTTLASTGDETKREAMRATLLSQGWNPADIDAAFPPPPAAYRVQQAVAAAITALRKHQPRSEKTWAPYLQLLADGLPDMCPCPCPACAVGPCPCLGGGEDHHLTCAMPDGEPYDDCAERLRGVPELPVEEVNREVIEDAAWWAERRGLKRTVARNVRREARGRNLLHSDGRGARESFIQACRWMFTWLVDTDKVSSNPAEKVKLPPRQEAPARSLTPEEFVEVYGVAVSTGQDPVLDGLILRHLLIQAVRRGALLGLTCEGLKVANCEIGYWDQKKKTWRFRPTTRTHLADLVTHAIVRGPRVAAPPDAPEEQRRQGIPALTASSPVFYAQPIDTFDENGYFVSREARPITRKRTEGLIARIRRNLPWTENVELRCHDIRHTSGRMIYKSADQQMAKLHLAHDGGSTTDHYLKERLDELAKLKEQLFEPQRARLADHRPAPLASPRLTASWARPQWVSSCLWQPKPMRHQPTSGVRPAAHPPGWAPLGHHYVGNRPHSVIDWATSDFGCAPRFSSTLTEALVSAPSSPTGSGGRPGAVAAR